MASRARNKANDPLQNFDGDVNMDGLAGDEDGDGNDEEEVLDEEKFFDNDDEEEDMTKEEKNQAYLDDEGYGKSSAGRNAWKQKHNKGKFNRKIQQEKHEHLHKW